MTDLHLYILRMIARRRRVELDDADVDDRHGGSVSAGRRRDLEQVSGQANANLEAAEARRRYPSREPAR